MCKRANKRFALFVFHHHTTPTQISPIDKEKNQTQHMLLFILQSRPNTTYRISYIVRDRAKLYYMYEILLKYTPSGATRRDVASNIILNTFKNTTKRIAIISHLSLCGYISFISSHPITQTCSPFS